MSVTKNVYVLMLALVIVLSGCFGVGTDAQDTGDSSQMNQQQSMWYVAGIANHTCIAQPGTPQYQSGNGSNSGYRYCINDDDTLEDEWVRIQNYTVIHQDSDTGINVHSYATSIWGGRIGTICINGAIAGWGITPDNGDSYGNSNPQTVVEGLLPFAGLECDHYLYGIVYYNEPYQVHWHVAYEVFTLNQGPHN